jgi:predicted enzyme related to lactoylglutathione lyase
VAEPSSNRVHHVVWCVRPESLPRVRRFWEEAIGLPVQDLDLPELGIHVLISWQGGIEIISPVYETGLLVEPARGFLATHGEGVYTVVFDVAALDDVVSRISRQGGRLAFEETISPEEVDARQLAAGSPERFAIRQAAFDPICGLRLCLQELTPAAE